MKTTTIALIIFSFMTIGLTQCKKDDDKKATTTPTVTPTETSFLIGESQIDELGLSIKVFTDTAPFVGYNRIYTEITDMNKSDGNYTVSYLPSMDMGMMSHRCPIEDPVPTATNSNLYKGAVIFIMESAGMGSWTLEVLVTDESSMKTESVVFDLEVIMPEEERVFSFISETDAQPIFVTLIEPSEPFVGINDFEIAIHSRENHDSFPAVEDLMVEMEPEMPTMGHGSPDNVNPMHTENGHYVGEVNFTMPGYWKVNLDFKNLQGDTVQTGTSFDITF